MVFTRRSLKYKLLAINNFHMEGGKPDVDKKSTDQIIEEIEKECRVVIKRFSNSFKVVMDNRRDFELRRMDEDHWRLIFEQVKGENREIPLEGDLEECLRFSISIVEATDWTTYFPREKVAASGDSGKPENAIQEKRREGETQKFGPSLRSNQRSVADAVTSILMLTTAGFAIVGFVEISKNMATVMKAKEKIVEATKANLPAPNPKVVADWKEFGANSKLNVNSFYVICKPDASGAGIVTHGFFNLTDGKDETFLKVFNGQAALSPSPSELCAKKKRGEFLWYPKK